MAKVDPGFTPINPKNYSAETLRLAALNAAPGQTAQEYLASRGGVNASGFFGDSWSATRNLTDEEYAAANAQGGGAAINKATAEKRFRFAPPIIAKGDPITPTADKTYTAPDGRIFTDITAYNHYIDTKKQDEKTAAGKSAFDILFEEMKRYNLESLAEEVKGYIVEGLSKTEFLLRLQQSSGYQKRFSANKARIDKGLRALSAAEYISLEDQYQDIMRRYGLPESYYTKGALGVQEGFTKLIGNDVSNVELEDRIMTGQKRIINSNPEVLAALKRYWPEIGNADILAYTLDPKNAIENIKRKVTAAEIGGSAIQAGLGITGTRAEELGAAGITKDVAQQGFKTIADIVPRGSQLAEIYKQSPYTQKTAETELFSLAGSTEATKQRKKITELETSEFGAKSGMGSLSGPRAGQY